MSSAWLGLKLSNSKIILEEQDDSSQKDLCLPMKNVIMAAADKEDIPEEGTDGP